VQEYEAFAGRDLSEFSIAYFFVDGVAERLHAGLPREAVLCAWGITEDGLAAKPSWRSTYSVRSSPRLLLHQSKRLIEYRAQFPELLAVFVQVWHAVVLLCVVPVDIRESLASRPSSFGLDPRRAQIVRTSSRRPLDVRDQRRGAVA
jgi:hypothetical protein